MTKRDSSTHPHSESELELCWTLNKFPSYTYGDVAPRREHVLHVSLLLKISCLMSPLKGSVASPDDHISHLPSLFTQEQAAIVTYASLEAHIRPALTARRSQLMVIDFDITNSLFVAFKAITHDIRRQS